jgi:hypothetical protein
MAARGTLLATSATALVGAVVMLFAANLGSANRPTTYRLRRGDYVDVPALHWTCVETVLTRGAAPSLACDSNDKPISRVVIQRREIVVHAVIQPSNCPSSTSACAIGTPSAPISISDGRYTFRFNHN